MIKKCFDLFDSKSATRITVEAFRAGREWKTLCPKHADKQPSLYINEEKRTFHCFGCSFSGSLYDLSKDHANRKPPSRQIMMIYDYLNEAGTLVYQTVRFLPKDFRQRRPDGNGEWVWNLDGIDLIPYRLPELLSGSDPVLICEGEKDVDRLRSTGLTATTNPMGAGKWKPSFNRHLKGRDVVILRDNDEPGLKHGAKIARTLTGIARSVKVVDLPGLPVKGDVSDFLDNGGTKEDLLRIVAETEPLTTPPAETETEENSEKKRPTQAEVAISLSSSLSLFHDTNEEPFAFLSGECVPVRSKKFRQFISYKYYRSEGKALNSDNLNQVLIVLEAKALFDNPEVQLWNRVAKKAGAFWYDLGNGKVVKITAEGWEVVDAPILFRRYSHQQPQVQPIVGGDPHEVFTFLNVSAENRLLVLIYIVSSFIPDIPHPIFHPHGPQGAGKTCLCNAIKKLTDPSTIEAIITPRDPTQLVQLLAHHHVCLFDNLSSLPDWMSDILAQACTGGGFSKRQLYTDDDDIIYRIKRCIGLNGINLLISKPDLMDRSILLTLERINPSQRMEEAELWSRFEAAKPRILGGIFDTVSRAMKIYPDVKLPFLHRMADFTRWGVSIAEVLGGGGKDFLTAYMVNVRAQNEEVVQGNTLAHTVLKFMSEKDKWEGLIREAYEELTAIAKPGRNDSTFPRSERSLRKHLERIKSTLIEFGVTFTIGKREAAGIPIHFQKDSNFASSFTLSTSFSKPLDNSEADERNHILSTPAPTPGNSPTTNEKVDDVPNVINLGSSWQGHTEDGVIDLSDADVEVVK